MTTRSYTTLWDTTRNTVNVIAQSSSSIRVDIASDLQISRKPMNHIRFLAGILKLLLAAIRPHRLAC